MNRRKAVAGTAIGVGALAFGGVVHADIIGHGNWSATAWQLHQGISSNQVGFWQTLMCANTSANSVMGPVDASFGSQTKSATKIFQQQVLGYNTSKADGVVDTHTWNDAQNGNAPGGAPLLSPAGGGYFTYYAGGTSTGLYQNGTSSGIWKYNHGSGTYKWATNSDTTPSASCVFGI